MMSPSLEIQIIAVVTATACALPGVFLVLRRMSLMSDAISHSILLGIVVGFFWAGSLNSPLLIAGAAAVGLLTVGFTELLKGTRLLKEDSAIGTVFPALFFIGVILVSRYAGNVHLDTDAVLLGEIAFAPFDRMVVLGRDIGPRSLYTMAVILLLNILYISLFYKELKLSTFDAGLAGALGFLPLALHYGLMAVVSITAVGAFDSVGSILVVALMIAPPAAAYLLTERLSVMILLSALIAALSAMSGYWVARILDASIAGSIAGMCGILFLITYLLSPTHGMVARYRRKRRQRIDFAVDMLLVHLMHHQGDETEAYESSRSHLRNHFNWSDTFAERVAKQAVRQKNIQQESGVFQLTDTGKERASQVMLR